MSNFTSMQAIIWNWVSALGGMACHNCKAFCHLQANMHKTNSVVTLVFGNKDGYRCEQVPRNHFEAAS